MKPHGFISLACLWALSCLLAGSAPAQPRLTFEADTIFFGNREGAVNEVRFWNDGTEPLLIDSLKFGLTPRGWSTLLSTPDSTYELNFSFGSLHIVPPPEITLMPQDTALFEITWLDPCLICKQSSAAGDTLFIYANTAAPNPVLLFVDLSLYVSTESTDPRPASRLDIYPNPAQQYVTIELETEHAGVAEVAMYNVIGQVLHRESVRLTPGVAQRVQWQLAGRRIPSGIYFVEFINGKSRQTQVFAVQK